MPLFSNPLTFDFSTIDWKVIIGVVALLVTGFGILYFQWWRNRRRFSYEVLSDELLVSTEKAVRDKVEIRYEGERVANVRLLVIKVINDGYQPIKRDDFQSPIRFVFPHAKLLTAEKINLRPENLATEIHYADDWLVMDQTLFNRKDYVQFKVLLSNYTGVKIDARIIGVSEIGTARELSSTLLSTLLIIGGAIGFIGLGVYIQFIINLNAGVESNFLIMIGLSIGILLVGGAFIACIGFVSDIVDAIKSKKT